MGCFEADAVNGDLDDCNSQTSHLERPKSSSASDYCQRQCHMTAKCIGFAIGTTKCKLYLEHPGYNKSRNFETMCPGSVVTSPFDAFACKLEQEPYCGGIQCSPRVKVNSTGAATSEHKWLVLNSTGPTTIDLIGQIRIALFTVVCLAAR